MFYFHILQCADNKRYYGHTGDLKKRLANHKNGKNKATKPRKPLKLVYYEEFDSRITLLEITPQNSSLTLRIHQAWEICGRDRDNVIFEKYRHVFVVASYGKKAYIIDPLLAMYFNPSLKQAPQDGFYGEDGFPGEIIRKASQSKYPHWIKSARKLLTAGYIELTDDTANMYASALRGKFPLDRTFDKNDFLQPSTLDRGSLAGRPTKDLLPSFRIKLFESLCVYCANYPEANPSPN